MRQFNTSIKLLMESKNEYDLTHKEQSTFLSDWDVEVDTKPYGILLNNDVVNPCSSNINSYYYWTDEHGYAPLFASYYKQKYNQIINLDTFLIGNNGTSSIMLSMIALGELSINRILVFTPVYFSTLNLLEMLKFQIYRYDLKMEDNFQINFEELDEYIRNNRIESLFVTDPVFGTGVEHTIQTYSKLSQIIKKYNLLIIIDYMYGGMLWADKNFIFNNKSHYIINNIPNLIFIESIAKRMFINGIKFSLIFSSPTIIRKIKRLSIYTTGSMCLNQLEIFKNTYITKNIEAINKIIFDNANKASNMYNKICSFLIGKNCIVSNCNSSFFFVLGIPKVNKKDDMEIALNLLKSKGILTIPHSRYLLENKKYYCFRVNLLLHEETLFDGISKIIF